MKTTSLIFFLHWISISSYAYLFPRYIEGKWGFCDEKNEMHISAIYERVGLFYNGIAPVKLNGNFYFIDEHGKMINKSHYDAIIPFVHDVACVQKKGKWGIINRNGNFLLKPKYEFMFSGNSHIVSVSDDRLNFSFFDTRKNKFIDLKLCLSNDLDKEFYAVFNGNHFYLWRKDSVEILNNLGNSIFHGNKDLLLQTIRDTLNLNISSRLTAWYLNKDKNPVNTPCSSICDSVKKDINSNYVRLNLVEWLFFDGGGSYYINLKLNEAQKSFQFFPISEKFILHPRHLDFHQYIPIDCSGKTMFFDRQHLKVYDFNK